jgi:hypothetical protein
MSSTRTTRRTTGSTCILPDRIAGNRAEIARTLVRRIGRTRRWDPNHPHTPRRQGAAKTSEGEVGTW